MNFWIVCDKESVQRQTKVSRWQAWRATVYTTHTWAPLTTWEISWAQRSFHEQLKIQQVWAVNKNMFILLLLYVRLILCDHRSPSLVSMKNIINCTFWWWWFAGNGGVVIFTCSCVNYGWIGMHKSKVSDNQSPASGLHMVALLPTNRRRAIDEFLVSENHICSKYCHVFARILEEHCKATLMPVRWLMLSWWWLMRRMGWFMMG